MYQFFDFFIDSNIPLPELPEVESGAATISFQLSVEPLLQKQNDWLHHWRLPDGKITISCARVNGDFYLRFPDLADFKIGGGCTDILCCPSSGVSDEMIKHLLLDQVIPRLASHTGEIVLHASAIVMDGQAIVFLGDTGWGKSTIAASFNMNGYQLLNDDCLLLRQKNNAIIGIPNYVGIRLWPDSFDAVVDADHVLNDIIYCSSKRRLILHKNLNTCNEKIPIGAIFVLNSPDKSKNVSNVKIDKITGAEVFMELIKHSFMLDVTDMRKADEKFSAIGQIATSMIPVYRLTYKRHHMLLNSLCNTIKMIVARH